MVTPDSPFLALIEDFPEKGISQEAFLEPIREIIHKLELASPDFFFYPNSPDREFVLTPRVFAAAWENARRAHASQALPSRDTVREIIEQVSDHVMRAIDAAVERISRLTKQTVRGAEMDLEIEDLTLLTVTAMALICKKDLQGKL